MCGIVGLISFDGNKIEESELRIFTNSLMHRGPDGSDIFVDTTRKVGLGHTRTVTFDTSSAGIQPMSYLNGRYQITFNGDILNFLEIRKELEILGHKFKTETDTEVLIAAYAQWGEDCQFKFNGDWAFAIWDNLKKNLFISRDRFGSKPIYYIKTNKYFIFASELKAFMALPKKFRPDFNYGFLLWLGYNYGSLNTFLKDVYLLQSGHQININSNNKIKIDKWWSTIDHLVEVPNNYNDQVERFKELFFSSCKLRLRSDVPMAASLSGGIDSSSVCSVVENIKTNNPKIQRHPKNNLNVFIGEFLNDENSELEFAKEVTLNKKMQVNKLVYDKFNLSPEQLNKTQFDIEWIDSDTVQLSLMYKKMREKGFRISLDGSSPDESLGGAWEDPYFALVDEVQFFRNNKRFKDLIDIKNNLNNKSSKSKYPFLIRKIIGPKNYSRLVSKYNNIKYKGRYNYNKYNLVEKSELVFPKEDNLKRFNYFDAHNYRRFHYIDTQYYSLKWDKSSMAHGVATRAPFMDKDLVTYIFSLPSSAKIGNGYTKRILRDSMKNLVPESVLKRKDKRGFTHPNNWYNKNMNDYFHDTMSSLDFLDSNLFDGKKLKKNYENNSPHISSKILMKYIQVNSLIKSFKQLYK